MKHIIRNESVMNMLEKPIENMIRTESKGFKSQMRLNDASRREVLTLYRDVWKMTSRFDWKNEDGLEWRDILRRSARVEFEEAKDEPNPLVVAQFVLTWKDVNLRLHEKVNAVQLSMMTHVEDTRNEPHRRHDNLDPARNVDRSGRRGRGGGDPRS